MPTQEEAAEREAKAKAQEEQKQAMLASVMEPAAKERLNRVALVKPDVAAKIEMMILGAVQRGAIQGRVSEAQVIGMLEKVGGGTAAGPKISFHRKPGFDDEEDDF